MSLRKLFTWLAIGISGLLVLLVLGGLAYQEISESRDLDRFPPPGELVDIEGNRMHIHCLGQGSPTVVLEQGLNAMASGWGEVHEMAARVTRVCAYDRAGLGYSDPIDHPTRAPEVAERLSKLLDGAGLDDDLLLVGWSAGGVYIREFYRQRPERVQAMLLIESSHERQTRRYPVPLEQRNSQATLELASYLAPLGLVRLSGMVRSRFESFKGSEESKERLIALYEQSHVAQTMLRETEAFNFDIDGDPPPSLGDLPLIVLTEGQAVEAPAEESVEAAEYRRKKREVERALQRELASLSSRGRQIVATESGHAIHFDQPELVVEAIRELVRLTRNGSP